MRSMNAAAAAAGLLLVTSALAVRSRHDTDASGGPPLPATPHEPAGYMVLTERSFTTEPEGTWRACCAATGGSGEGDLQFTSDPTAPQSPPDVAVMAYPANGQGTATWRASPLPPGHTGIYMSLWFKHSANWQNHAMSSLGFLAIRPKPDVHFALDSAIRGHQPVVIVQNRLPNSPLPSLLRPNVTTGATIQHGVWHQLEVVFQTNNPGANDGSVRWWLDGTLYGSYDNVGMPGSAGDLDWEGVGVMGSYTPQAEPVTIAYDHLYVSADVGPPGPTSDRIVISNNTPGGSLPPKTVILYDAKLDEGGGPTEVIARLLADDNDTPTIWKDLSPANLLPPDPNTSSLVAVFSPGDMAKVYDTVALWSPNTGDVFPVDLSAGPLNVDLAIWVMAQSAGTWPSDDVLKANALYDMNRVGVSFTKTVTEVWNGADAATAAALAGTGCGNASALRADGRWFAAGHMNVYYVDEVLAGSTPMHGHYCGFSASEPNVLFVSVGMHSPPTLAHELGHAFGLGPGHTNSVIECNPTQPATTPVGCKNIMLAGPNSAISDAREWFTIGQVFRMVVSDISWLNVSPGGSLPPVRSLLEPRRTCDPNPQINIPCPAISTNP